jgi:Zn-dependent protease with chaperone function
MISYLQKTAVVRMMVILFSWSMLLTSFASAWQGEGEPLLSPIAAEIKALYDNPDFKKRTELKDSFVKYLLNFVDKVKALESKQGFCGKTWYHFFYTFFLGVLVEPALPGGLILLNSDQTPKLHTRLKELCKKLSIPVPMIFLVQDEKFFNAAAASFSHGTSFIIIGESLLKKLSEAELNNLLAHELAHIKHNHLPKRLLLNIGVLSTFIFVILKCFQHYQSKNEPVILVPALEVEVVGPLDKKALLLSLAAVFACLGLIFAPALYSRTTEKEADMTALKVTQDKQGFIGVMEGFEGYLDGELDHIKQECDFVVNYAEKLGENQSGFKSFIKFLANFYYNGFQMLVKETKEGDSLLATHPSLKVRKEYGAAFQIKQVADDKAIVEVR